MPDHSPGAPDGGTVTFLFTDIEGSTRLIQQVGSAYPEILALHNLLIRAAVETSSGVEVKTEGDAFFVAFQSATDGVRATITAQRALAAASWPGGITVRVRMGVHTGEASRAGADYIGLDVHRAARIAAAAHGGQVLVSESTHQLAAGGLPNGVRFADKGEHRLKDLDKPEHLYELVIDDLPAGFPPIRSVSMRFAILPSQLSAFVGRESEIKRVRGLLAATRLLTLTGPGGTGKTRLAIQVAQAAADAFPDGVAFVPLAPLSDPQLVSGTIRETLGLREEPGRSSLETITDRIRGSRLLLILDNFEQLLPAAGIVAGLLERTHELTILVTSRSPLRQAGEQEFPVPPLRLPVVRDAGDLEALRRSEAVALFAQRATTVWPDFTLDRSNAIPISEICTRLDGLPLAIELAAARIGLLPPEAMLSRLERSLDLLQSRSTDRPDRQRTLRGAIDWSYDLLDEVEQVAFRRLAVFVGGWDLEDAEAVAPADGWDQLDLLGRLVDHSLIVQEARAGEPRFGMLETIREYGLDRLTRTGELEAIGRAHAQRFRELSIELAPGFTASVDALDGAARQHENIRAALRWSIDHGELEAAMEAVGALWRFWHLRGHIGEGERWANEVLAKAPDSATHGRVRALNALGGLAYWRGDYASAGSAYEAMLDASRLIGDRASEAEANYSLGYIRGIEHDNEGARAAYRESGRIAGLIGDRLGEANAMGGVALIDLLDGRYQEAREGMAEALPIFKAAGDRWLYLNAQGIMGRVLQHLGEYAEARAAALDQLDGSVELGDGTLTALALRILASVTAQGGDFERALRLEGASRSVVERLGGEAPSALIPEVRPDVLAARAGVRRAAVDRWLAQGRELSEREAVALAHARPGANREPPR